MPDIIDAIRYCMEMRGYTQADLGRLLGSRQRASDVLNGKRRLTMEMAWKLNRRWGVPAHALITPPRTRGRKSAAQHDAVLPAVAEIVLVDDRLLGPAQHLVEPAPANSRSSRTWISISSPSLS